MDLLPALDLRHGRAVRLRQGDAARATVYDRDPERRLTDFAAAGVALVHVVDLDAAFGEPPQRALLARLAGLAAAERRAGRGPALQLGGGLRDRAAIEWALGAGFTRLVVGSLAARDPWAFAALAQDLPGRLVPALDCTVDAGDPSNPVDPVNAGSSGDAGGAVGAGGTGGAGDAGAQLRVAGWREPAGRSLGEICAALSGLPCPAVLVTDVERDGMLAGPNLALACRVARAAALPALLSGGVRSLADLAAARQEPEIAGVVVGRALYEGAFTLAEAMAVLAGPLPAPHSAKEAQR